MEESVVCTIKNSTVDAGQNYYEVELEDGSISYLASSDIRWIDIIKESDSPKVEVIQDNLYKIYK